QGRAGDALQHVELDVRAALHALGGQDPEQADPAVAPNLEVLAADPERGRRRREHDPHAGRVTPEDVADAIDRRARACAAVADDDGLLARSEVLQLEAAGAERAAVKVVELGHQMPIPDSARSALRPVLNDRSASSMPVRSGGPSL